MEIKRAELDRYRAVQTLVVQAPISLLEEGVSPIQFFGYANSMHAFFPKEVYGETVDMLAIISDIITLVRENNAERSNSFKIDQIDERIRVVLVGLILSGVVDHNPQSNVSNRAERIVASINDVVLSDTDKFFDNN